MSFTDDPRSSSGTAPETTRVHFARELLHRLGRVDYIDSPVTRFIVSQMQWEGIPASWNNPLATVEPGPGSHPAPNNSAGVQMFPTLAGGLDTTVQNLQTVLYDDYRAALVTGTTTQAAAALQLSGWCGGPASPCPGYGAKVLKLADTYWTNLSTYLASALKQCGEDAPKECEVFLLRDPSNGGIWVSNWQTKRHVTDPAEVDQIAATLAQAGLPSKATDVDPKFLARVVTIGPS